MQYRENGVDTFQPVNCHFNFEFTFDPTKLSQLPVVDAARREGERERAGMTQK